MKGIERISYDKTDFEKNMEYMLKKHGSVLNAPKKYVVAGELRAERIAKKGNINIKYIRVVPLQNILNNTYSDVGEEIDITRQGRKGYAFYYFSMDNEKLRDGSVALEKLFPKYKGVFDSEHTFIKNRSEKDPFYNVPRISKRKFLYELEKLVR